MTTPWIVKQKDFDTRFDICKSCSSFEEESSLCKMCGCDMNSKCQNAYAECPDKKWGALI